MTRKKEEHTVSLSFNDFKAQILLRLPKGTELSAPQGAVLYSVWANCTYESLVKSYEYDVDYLRSVASQLWNALSPSFNQKVTKNNLLVLLAKEALEKNSNQQNLIKTYGIPARTDFFCGRKNEIKDLMEAILSSRCVIVSGASGVGKTSLVSRVFNNFENMDKFELQVWIFSESNELETDAEQVFRVSKKNRTVSATKGLIDLLRFSKSLIVIDAVDSWLKENSKAAEDFIKNVVETNHNSCLLLNVREPFEFGHLLEKHGRLIKNYRLNGLSLEESRLIFKEKEIDGSIDKIIDSYRGIPSLLLYACEIIKYMGGDTDSFVKNKTAFSIDPSKQRLSRLFASAESSINNREKSLIYYIYKNSQEGRINLKPLMEEFQINSSYDAPQIVAAIKELEKKSLITIDNSTEDSKILLHSEVRGYIYEDPLSVFKSYKVSQVS